MSSSELFDSLGPDLLAQLRAYVGGDPLKLSPDCDHAPIPCAWISKTDHGCKIQKFEQCWAKRSDEYPDRDNPLVQAMQTLGADPLRVRMVLNLEGYGLTLDSAKGLVHAQRRLQSNKTAVLPASVEVCDQCKPGTNTYALQGSSYEGGCFFLPVCVAANSDIAHSGKVLCIGAGGELRWCAKDEYMAVSHVWDHGWQGDSEKGICTRLLDMLLNIASIHGLEYIWLDVAMIPRDSVTKAMSINSMNFVYSSAKMTIVCDRLLIAMHGGSDREQAMAICLCDWMTRVWTMQEAILSPNLVFQFGDGPVNGRELRTALIEAPDSIGLEWQAYGAIKTLDGMVASLTSPMMDRVRSLARERLTTKPKDLVRAVYPLFELSWPSADTTLEQGQEKLLRHLGPDAGRLASLYGPIMPKPFSWAPLSIAGTSGAMPPRGSQMPVTPDGLHGRWPVWPVTVLDEAPAAEYTSANTFARQFATLTGTCKNTILFSIPGVQGRFVGSTFSRRENTYPWQGRTLFLFWANNTGKSVTREMDYFHLVLRFKERHAGGLPIFHRVGSILGSLQVREGGETTGLVVGERVEGYMV